MLGSITWWGTVVNKANGKSESYALLFDDGLSHDTVAAGINNLISHNGTVLTVFNKPYTKP